jgi:hypothetical protein
MGPAEVAWRLLEAGRHALLLPRIGLLEREAVSVAEARPLSEAVTRPVPEIDGHLRGIDFGTQDRVLSLAAPWLSHRATLFERVEFRLGDDIDWHCDYLSGIQAPLTYSAFINHRDLKIAGNVKYVWELNRLQHLIPLALAGIWTEREAYELEVEEQLSSWCRQNPFMRGLNWKSPLEAALRLISWAVLAFVRGGTLSRDLQSERELAKSAFLHQYFIRHFHSRHSSANNHLIGEMAGLYIGATVWPSHPSAGEWRAYARDTLKEQIHLQTEPDGVGCERAVEYHLFVTEFFILAGALGEANGDCFGQEYWDRISRMLGFTASICDQSGNFPLFGDGDNGQVINLGERRAERAASHIRLGACLASGQECPDLRSVLLLWGQSPADLPLKPDLKPAGPLEIYPSGGYYILSADRGSEDEMVVVFDAGPFGFPPLYAHAHADALSFWLSFGGNEFVIDPGTYCYDSSKWRSYFRSTAAHNTIRVDGVEQALEAGVFLWSTPVNAYLEVLEEGEGCVEIEACHDGYRRLADPVIHHRRLRLFKKSRTLAIIDRLECEGTHGIEIFFHFSQECRAAQIRNNCLLVTNGDKALLLKLDSRFDVKVAQAAEDPIAGWVSRSFGFKQPCITVMGRATINGSVPFFSEISPA